MKEIILFMIPFFAVIVFMAIMMKKKIRGWDFKEKPRDERQAGETLKSGTWTLTFFMAIYGVIRVLNEFSIHLFSSDIQELISVLFIVITFYQIYVILKGGENLAWQKAFAYNIFLMAVGAFAIYAFTISLIKNKNIADKEYFIFMGIYFFFVPLARLIRYRYDCRHENDEDDLPTSTNSEGK